MGDNLKILTLEKDIVDVLNKSTLPILVKKMVLDKILAAATESMNQALQLETEAFNAEQSKEGEGNGIQ